MNIASNKPIICTINTDATVSIAGVSADGVKSNKLISLNSFLEAVRSSDESIELPILPNGIRKFKQSGESCIVAIEHEPQIVEISYRGSSYKVPTPRSLWISLLSSSSTRQNSYRIIKTIIYSLDMPLMSETQTLYDWPFPNHSVDYTPGICWGNDDNYENIRHDATLRNLSSLYSMYFSANFNDDLGWKFSVPRNSPHGDYDTGSYHLDHIIDKEIFENRLLKRTGDILMDKIDRLLGQNRG